MSKIGCDAQALAERLRATVNSVAVVRDEQNSMWKVNVGSFQTVAESGEFGSRLRSEGVDTFVVEQVK